MSYKENHYKYNISYGNVTNSSNYSPVAIDNSGAQIIVGKLAQKQVDGDTYIAQHSDMAIAATTGVLDLYMNPSGTEKIWFRIYSQQNGWFRVYEDPTISANGTAITPVNQNRNSSNVTSSLVYHTPTVTSVGSNLLIEERINGIVRGRTPTPALYDDAPHLSLNGDRNYLIRLANDSASAGEGQLTILFY